MKANYINMDGGPGLHVEFKNGYIMDIDVGFEFEFYKNVHFLLLKLFWVEKFMTDNWDVDKMTALLIEMPEIPWSFLSAETNELINSEYFTQIEEKIFHDYLADRHSEDEKIQQQ